MPRRGRSASPPARRAAPARPPPRAAAPPPRASHPPATVPHQPTQPMMAPGASQGPGIMGQMMATAGGVAIGSTVGHVVGHAITGGGRGGGEAAAEVASSGHDASSASAPIGNYGQQHQQQPQEGACSWEMKQFMNCAQTQHDLSLCEGFNEALRNCRQYNGINQ